LPGTADAGRVRLWEFPWETLRRRRDAAAAVSAAAARELAPLLITLEEVGPGARETRRMVRPLYAARLREFRGDLDGPEGAKMAYLRARPSAAAMAEALRQAPPEQADGLRRLYDTMKEDATYWLGVLTLAEGEYATAADYLGRMILEAAPDSRWADAARTNLAVAEQALGHTDKAIALLRADPSPQRFGSRLEAARLEKTAAPKRTP
jgi:tetratricopeptide (TPR) repeat protein